MLFWPKNKDKIALDDAVRAAGKAASALIVEEVLAAEHDFPPTATHFGGNPYFEQGDVWPIYAETGQPYDFICQVNLNDCPERPNVPFDLLTVFFCWGLELGVDEEHACIVRTYRNASAAKAEYIVRPAALDSTTYLVSPCTVRSEKYMT